MLSCLTMLSYTRCGSGNLKDRKITQHATYLILHGCQHIVPCTKRHIGKEDQVQFIDGQLTLLFSSDTRTFHTTANVTSRKCDSGKKLSKNISGTSSLFPYMVLFTSVKTQKLGCLFLQESSGFLFFLLLWRFFYRNHDSCSTVTFLECHQETCLYGAYIECYIGYQFVRQKQSTIQFYGILGWLLSTIIAAPPPPLLRRHCYTATTTATPIAAPPLPLPLLHRQSHRCTT